MIKVLSILGSSFVCGIFANAEILRNITIPTIDISGERDRHVIIAQGTEDVYQGHPCTVLLPDGKTMFVVWCYEHAGNLGPIKRSDDGGLTWSEKLEVPDNWADVGNVPNIFYLEDREGVGRLIVFGGRNPFYQSVSEDGGGTWSPMTRTEEPLVGWTTPITIVPVDHGKRHLMWYERDQQGRPRPGVIWQSASEDGGLTWGDSRPVVEMAGASEPAVIRSPDGGQLLMFIREQDRRYNSLYSTSDDEGRTWSEPQELPAALTGDRHLPRYAPDGRLVVVFRDTFRDGGQIQHSVQRQADDIDNHAIAWVGEYSDIVEGREGEYRVKLFHSYGGIDHTYPGFEILPDGTMVVTTYIKYNPGPERQSVINTRFRMEELDKKFLELQSIDPALTPTEIDQDPGPDYGRDLRRFEGIPGMAVSNGGRLWATWYAAGRGDWRGTWGGVAEGPDNYVLVGTSHDDGKIWSEPVLVIDPPGKVRAFDPVLWLAPTGDLWLFYSQSYDWWDGRGGVWVTRNTNPDRKNGEWSAPKRIADGVMMNKPTVLSNGDWLLPISVWNVEPSTDSGDVRFVPDEFRHWNPANVGTHVYRSQDEGRTFQRIGTAEIPDTVHDEHMIVERKDGSLWLLARTTYGIGESFSKDKGKTWSLGVPSSIPHAPSRFHIRRLSSGSLLLVKNNPTMDNTWITGIRGNWRLRSHITAYISHDDGETWGGGLLLDSRAVISYPDGHETDDGWIYVIYDHNRYADREILMAKFKEEDVLQGKIVSDGSRLRIPVNSNSNGSR